jgi:hypothetical protein
MPTWKCLYQLFFVSRSIQFVDCQYFSYAFNQDCSDIQDQNAETEEGQVFQDYKGV